MANRGHLGDGRQETEWDELQKTIGAFRDDDGNLAITQDKLADLVEAVAETIDPMEHKTLDELDELEDDEDDDVLNMYRQKRLAEIKAAAAKDKYGRVVHIGAVDWKREVTEHKDGDVVVLLHQPGVPDATIMEHIFRVLAAKFRHVKFVQIKATDAIQNYPDKLVPSVLVYRDTNIIKQWIGLATFASQETTPEDVEWALSEAGIVESDLEGPTHINTGGQIRLNFK